MELLKKSFAKIDSINYPTYKKAKTILLEASGVNSPLSMVNMIFSNSFFKESGFNIHALGSSRKVIFYKYIDSTSDKFISFFNLLDFLKFLPKVLWLHVLLFTSYIKPEKLFYLKINNIYIGDVIYDEYLRYNQYGTIKKFNFKLFLKISEAFYFYFYFKDLYNKYDYEYVFANHNCYIRQSIMARMAISLNIKVLQNKYVSVIKKTYTLDSLFNENIFKPSNQIVKSIYSNDELFKKLSENPNVTLEVNAGINHYKEPSNYDGFIKNIKNIKNKYNKKLVVIYAHAYTDNVTGSDGRKFVFMDHYLWVKNTLELCSKNPNIVTIVKPHPAEEVYLSKITTAMIFKEVQDKIDSNDVILCPDGLDFKEYPEIVDLVITSRGTIGIEIPCLGVPVLAQMKDHAVFSNNDVVLESGSYDEYASAISKAHLIPRLSEEETKKAIVFAKLSNMLVFYENSDMLAGAQDLEKHPDELKSVFDLYVSDKEVYRDDVDHVIYNKLIQFELKHKKSFFADMQSFLDNDTMIYLAEVNYEGKLKECF